MNTNNTNNNTEVLNLLSIVLGICALCLLVLSTLFNVYSFRISDEEELIITNKNILVDYKDGKDIVLKNVAPGSTLTYNFDLYSKDTATGISDYELYFDVTDSSFNGSMLYHKFECSSSLNYESGELVNMEDWDETNMGSIPTHTGTIKPGEIQTCKLTIYYSHQTTTKKNNLTGQIILKGKTEKNDSVNGDAN